MALDILDHFDLSNSFLADDTKPPHEPVLTPSKTHLTVISVEILSILLMF